MYIYNSTTLAQLSLSALDKTQFERKPIYNQTSSFFSSYVFQRISSSETHVLPGCLVSYSFCLPDERTTEPKQKHTGEPGGPSAPLSPVIP